MLEISGKCSSCDAGIDGFVRSLPRVDEITLYLCRDCGGITGWVKSSSKGGLMPPRDLAQPFVSPAPPAKCQHCGTGGVDAGGEVLFGELRTIRMEWDQIRTGEPVTVTVPCWACGGPARISWSIRAPGFFSFEANAGLYMWSMVALAVLLFPLLLILSPMIVPGWLLWRKLRGKCLRCGHLFTSYGSMPLVGENGGGSLHRCPSCKTFYYLPICGPAGEMKMTQEEVRQAWPEVFAKSADD